MNLARRKFLRLTAGAVALWAPSLHDVLGHPANTLTSPKPLLPPTSELVSGFEKSAALLAGFSSKLRVVRPICRANF
jgi:hypothetical protein